MDGFNVGGYLPGHTYTVEARLGEYLILAGYARAEPQFPSTTEETWTREEQRRAEDRIREELRDSRAKTIRSTDAD